MLLREGLDDRSLSMLEKKWTIQDKKARAMKSGAETADTLYQWQVAESSSACGLEGLTFQSSCGYDTASRQRAAGKGDAQTPWRRTAPYDFTSCIAHAYISARRWNTKDGKSELQVLRIVGCFAHNDACRRAQMVRYPAIPLADQVREVALRQLRQGARYVRHATQTP